jgi:hypothetical protein
MRDDMALFLALLFSVMGAVLLYDGVSVPGVNQTAKIIGGATFLSLALTMAWFVLRNWWEWKQIRGSYHRDRES